MHDAKTGLSKNCDRFSVLFRTYFDFNKLKASKPSIPYFSPLDIVYCVGRAADGHNDRVGHVKAA